MVKDIMLDIKEHDLLLKDKSNPTLPIFDAVWGNLFDEDEKQDVLMCNILVPQAYWSFIQIQDNEFTCSFKTTYKPSTEGFRIRLIALNDDSTYHLFRRIDRDFGITAYSFGVNRNIASPLSASMLPFIDIDGCYLVQMKFHERSQEFDKAYVYSAKRLDLNIDFSDNQAAQLLTLCAPGKSYRYPATGVGLINYLNRVVSHSDLEKNLETQFEADKKILTYYDFDNATCKLNVLFSPEQEVADTNLAPISSLDTQFFAQLDDEAIRKNTIITEVISTDLIETINNFDKVIEIVFFDNGTSGKIHINGVNGSMRNGTFNADGEEVERAGYCVVEIEVGAGSIIMFDDEAEDELATSPVFTINDTDATLLYTALIEQPYWITENCHKCMIITKPAVLKYTIQKSRVTDGKGLYLIPPTHQNLRYILAVVQDEVTGRLLGLVSDNTIISDVILDDLTQNIHTFITE